MFKDISFWCIVLTIVVVMVLHHILSHSDIIEGNTNDTNDTNDQKCGGTGKPCCWYNMWQRLDGDDTPLEKSEISDLKEDGTVYLPLNIPEPETDGWRECQTKCINTPGCVYFNHFSNGDCHITDGKEGSKITNDLIDKRSGNPVTVQSGRAFKLSESIPIDKRLALDNCGCPALGEKPSEGWPDTGTLIETDAIQYGNINGPREDCNGTPDASSSCDGYGVSVETALETNEATHFRCLTNDNINDSLLDNASNLNVDISGFATMVQQARRDKILEHISERKILGLGPDATNEAIDNEKKNHTMIREKYGLPGEANDVALEAAKLAERDDLSLATDATEGQVDAARNERKLQLDLYDLPEGATKDDLVKVMKERNASKGDIERATYCISADCTDDELATARNNHISIRREYRLPINASAEEVNLAIESSYLYDMTFPFTFTSCGKTGRSGPSLAQCKTAYGAHSNLGFDKRENFNVIGAGDGIQVWRVPVSGNYEIDVYGASGGGSAENSSGLKNGKKGGSGARIKGTWSLTKGDYYMIIVGQMGTQGGLSPNIQAGYEAMSGGGGGVVHIF